MQSIACRVVSLSNHGCFEALEQRALFCATSFDSRPAVAAQDEGRVLPRPHPELVEGRQTTHSALWLSRMIKTLTLNLMVSRREAASRTTANVLRLTLLRNVAQDEERVLPSPHREIVERRQTTRSAILLRMRRVLPRPHPWLFETPPLSYLHQTVRKTPPIGDIMISGLF